MLPVAGPIDLTMRFGTANSLLGATLAIFDLPTAQRIFDREGQFDFIYVTGTGPIGPDGGVVGDTIVLPELTEPWIFMHEAELALVIKGPAKNVARHDWRRTVFGYTGMIDVSARGEGRRTWKAGSWLGKSFDTFAPIGPCIATLDEIADPNDVHVRFWVDGQLRHNYNTDDMEHPVPELVEFSTSIMTLHSGDLIACGTNHEGLGPLQDGETVDFEIDRIGRMRLTVRDPLKRTWERGIYMGPDSTNPEAVKRNRPPTAR